MGLTADTNLSVGTLLSLDGGSGVFYGRDGTRFTLNGRKAFSELESSRLDHAPGKRLSVVDHADGKTNVELDPGKLSTLTAGVEQLELTVAAEKFDNGAHVRVVVSQRSEAPDEVRLTIHAEPDSAPHWTTKRRL